MMTRLLRALDGAMAALLLFAAYLNLNDPDPVRWVVLYGGCAAASAWSAVSPAGARPTLRWLAPVLAGVCFLWALVLFPELKHWHWSDLNAPMAAVRPEIEFGRECLGLLIAGAHTVRLPHAPALPVAPN